VRNPILAGTNRAFVRLDSGEYIAVDTNSIDATDLLLGWPVEPHATLVFRCLLQPHAVVLDIGANFGLYTAIAASIVGKHGKLYAFEANPHTFDFLRRTLYANRVLSNPNIAAVNLLVSNRHGRGTLHYIEQLLGGATVTDFGQLDSPLLDQWRSQLRSVDVEMTTIDEFLPPELQVDLVKIDVEGHEPFVMMGMEKTIARSPNIRFIIEFAESFLEHRLPAPDFLDYIHALGFRVCKILKHSALELHEPGQPLHGAYYLLLTRTPQEDMRAVARRRRRLRARLKRLIRLLYKDFREARYGL
jgi:FkbM family methyltransferase